MTSKQPPSGHPLRIDDAFDLETERMLLAGDDAVVARIWKFYHPRVAGLLRERFAPLLGFHAIEDVMSEAVASAWVSRDSFAPSQGRFRHWFTRIAINRGNKECRAQPARAGVQIDDWNSIANQGVSAASPNDDAPSPCVVLLRLAMRALSPNQRSVMEADLRHPSSKADVRDLAIQLATANNVIYATRSQGRRRLSALIGQLVEQFAQLGHRSRLQALREFIESGVDFRSPRVRKGARGKRGGNWNEEEPS